MFMYSFHTLGTSKCSYSLSTLRSREATWLVKLTQLPVTEMGQPSRLRAEAQWLPESAVVSRGTVAGMSELTDSEATKQMGADKHPAYPFGNYSRRVRLGSAHQALAC